jgi:DNA-binding NarL/FixJ family response regulator
MGEIEMEEKTKIVIVDDHPLFREGIKAIIARSAQYEIIGEAGNGREALRMALELNPQVVLVDISLPDQSGIQLTNELSRLLPSAAIIVVSVHSGNNYFCDAFQAGAKGYVVKEAVPETLLKGLDVVSGGGFFLDEPLSPEVIDQYRSLSGKRDQTDDTCSARLTPRQRQVLELLARGYSCKTIGDMLCISPRTVEKHGATIRGRLGLRGRADLTIFALRTGIIALGLTGS